VKAQSQTTQEWEWRGCRFTDVDVVVWEQSGEQGAFVKPDPVRIDPCTLGNYRSWISIPIIVHDRDAGADFVDWRLGLVEDLEVD